MLKKNIVIPALAAVVLAGIGTGVLSYATATKADTTTATVAVDTTAGGATTAAITAASTADTKPRGHAPQGGDGNVTAISGTTITMAEEADEGGASYTVDASSATFTNNGATGSISDIKVGDKI